MTDLQVKYQALLETQRANREQERLKELETTSKAELNKANVDKIREAEMPKLKAELSKVLAEIDKIQADTELSSAQKEKLVAEKYNQWLDFGTTIFRGLTWPIGPLVEGLSRGVGSGVGKLITA